MTLSEAMPGIIAGKKWRESSGHCAWRTGLPDLAFVTPIFYSADTWELEPERLVFNWMKGEATYDKNLGGWNVSESGNCCFLSDDNIDALYAASRKARGLGEAPAYIPITTEQKQGFRLAWVDDEIATVADVAACAWRACAEAHGIIGKEAE